MAGRGARELVVTEAPTTKERLVAAAVHQFAERGYNGASLRAIAAEADADLALIAYYFKNKAGLFLTIVDQTLAPALRIAEPRGFSEEEIPERIINWLLDQFETTPESHTLIAVLRTVLTPTYPQDDVHAQVLQRLEDVIVAVSGGPDAPREVYTFASTLLGVMLLRYVTPVEPISTVGREEIVALLAPRLRRIRQQLEEAS